MTAPARVALNRICATGLLLLVLCTASVSAAIAEKRDFKIEAQDAATALTEFGRQAGVQILFQYDSVKGHRTNAISGELEAKEAIRLLIEGTGLQVSEMENGVLVVEAGQHPPRKAAADQPYTLAQNDDRAAQVPREIPPAGVSQPTPESAQDGERLQSGMELVDIGEIVVTGTRLRGAKPVGSNVITIDRAEIDRGGFVTVQDVVRALPQNFRGGVSDFLTGSTDRETFSNTVEGNAPNLRGLGAGATLVLVNGRRMAPTGFEGIFSDITSIPLSAVERIEVLLDGASAIYGSDAIGGVVNIILRRDYQGAETRLQIGTVTDGDAQEYQLGQSFGTGWSTGQGLLAFEFYKREALLRQERALSADCDQRRFGGDNFCNSFNNPGTLITFDPNTFEQQTWAIPAGQDGRSLTPADFTAGTTNLRNHNEGSDLLPQQERLSLSGFVTQSVGDRLTLHASGLFSARDASHHGNAESEFLFVTSDHPFYVNPTGGTDPIFITYSFRDDLGLSITDTDIETYQAALTAAFKASETWLVTTDVGYSREKHDRVTTGGTNRAALELALSDPNPDTVFNPFGDGSNTNPDTLNAIRGTAMSSADSDLWTVGVTAEGPLLRLAGGEMRLAVGGEYRQHDFSSSGLSASLDAFQFQYDHELSAGFAELLIPLVGPANRRPGLNRLEVSLAGRYEKYEDFGETTNPKFGVEWSPVAGLAFIGSWGTSFKAPFVLDLEESANISFIFPIEDPLAPSGFSDALIWLGGNADLKEETATTWNVGVEIAPPSQPGLNLRLTYFDIEFDDRIETVFDPFTALADPNFADIVTRDPTAAEREMVCSRSTFDGNPDDCLNFPIAAIVDGRVSNAALVRNRGFDFLGSWRLESGVGAFTFDLNATYLTELARALRATSPLLQIMNTQFNPVDFRLRGSVSWARGGLEVTTFANYIDAYADTQSEPDRKIGSWTTFDLAVSYGLPFEDSSVLGGTTLGLNVQNLFDEDPSFFNWGLGYDGVNADLLGRFVSLQLRKNW